MKHLAFVLLVACGSSDLDPDDVTNLPPGDATGNALSGMYRMESLTVGCRGTCITEGVSACDVGTRLDDTVTVTQTDGALKIDVEGNDFVSRLEGGVDADGSYDVGAVRTQLGGSVTITARASGTLTASAMTGTARLHASGRGLDCRIETEVTGMRR